MLRFKKALLGSPMPKIPYKSNGFEAPRPKIPLGLGGWLARLAVLLAGPIFWGEVSLILHKFLASGEKLCFLNAIK